MNYRKPKYFDSFSCVGGSCEATCCAGWQIVIDESKMEEYLQVPGSFGARLFRSIDWGEGTFVQSREGRCSFLNKENLCDIYRELGPDMLCNTCREYPRHTEEFEELRELSLSLSCPVAARLMLEQREALELVEYSDEEEECWEDYEDFDDLLFSQLLDAREKLFNLVQQESRSLGEKLSLCMEVGKELQKCLDEERLFDMEDCVDAICHPGKETDGREVSGKEPLEDYELGCSLLEALERLEVLQKEWPEILECTKRILFQKGEENYREIWERFAHSWGDKSAQYQRWNRYGRQLLLFFLYTYFCGAVYDGWIYSKVMLAVGSTYWICQMACALWQEQGEQLGEDDFLRLAYRYAREIEHSDENLNALEEFFME